jgi:hypothetical protein
MINAKKKCQCGGPKEAHHQFCPTCWEKIPATLQDKFLSALKSLHSAISGCRIAIK